MSNSRPTPQPPEHTTTDPLCDEWGFYDPNRAGLAALLRRVPDAPPPRPHASKRDDSGPR